MTVVDPVYAQWLQSAGLWQVSTDAAAESRWAGEVQISERMTTLASKADAEAEAARQLAFLGGPLVLDEHTLLGEWAAHLGRVITISGDRLGYEGGANVFVVGVQDERAKGTSQVTVVRRMS